MIKRHFIHKYLSLKFLPLRIKSNFIKKKIKKNFNQNLSQFEEIIKSKKFSTFWFLNNIHAFDYFFPKDKNKKFSFLEIGSFEGMSALYVLSNFKNCDVYCIDLWNDTHDNRKNLKYDFNKIEENFNENLKEYKFEKIKNDSLSALKKIENTGKKFDYIYIDGSHEGEAILLDALASFKVLKKDGILIFDDIDVSTKDGNISPIIAIDTFLKSFKKNIKILYFKRLIFLRKIN